MFAVKYGHSLTLFVELNASKAVNSDATDGGTPQETDEMETAGLQDNSTISWFVGYLSFYPVSKKLLQGKKFSYLRKQSIFSRSATDKELTWYQSPPAMLKDFIPCCVDLQSGSAVLSLARKVFIGEGAFLKFDESYHFSVNQGLIDWFKHLVAKEQSARNTNTQNYLIRLLNLQGFPRQHRDANDDAFDTFNTYNNGAEAPLENLHGIFPSIDSNTLFDEEFLINTKIPETAQLTRPKRRKKELEKDEIHAYAERMKSKYPSEELHMEAVIQSLREDPLKRPDPPYLEFKDLGLGNSGGDCFLWCIRTLSLMRKVPTTAPSVQCLAGYGKQ
jgi:hypothetical protein